MATTQEEIQTKRNLAELVASIRKKYMKLRVAESKFEKDQERFLHTQDGIPTKFRAEMGKEEINAMLAERDDKQFGITKKGKLWVLGNTFITIQPDGIRLKDKIFRCTPGLLSLLTRQEPSGNTADDDADYATALRITGVHLNRFGALKNLQSYKCQNIIKPLFELTPKRSTSQLSNFSTLRDSSANDESSFMDAMSTPTGNASRLRASLSPIPEMAPLPSPISHRTRAKTIIRRARMTSMQKLKSGGRLRGVTKKIINARARNPKSQLVYWNNVNELVERLYLLQSAKRAGNTSVNNEIANIEAELREARIIR